MDGSEAIEALKSLRLGSAKDVHDDMKNLAAYLFWFSPSFVKAPFTAKFMVDCGENLIFVEEKGNLAICSKGNKDILSQEDLGISVSACAAGFKGCVIGDRKGRISVYDTEKYYVTMSGKVCESEVRFVTWNGRYGLAGSKDGEVIVLEENNINITGKIIQKLEGNIVGVDSTGHSGAVANNKGKVLMLNQEMNITKIFELNTEIQCIHTVKNYLALGIGHDIRILDLTDHTNIYSFPCEASITCMNSDNGLIFAGLSNSLIKVWTLDKWRDSVTLSGNTSSISQLIISNQVVHSLDSSSQIRVSRVPHIQDITNSLLPVVSLYPNSLVNQTFALLSTNEIISLSSKSQIFQCKSQVISIDFTDFSQVLVVYEQKETLSTHVKISLIHLTKPEFSEKELRTGSLPSVCASTNEFKYFVTGEMFRITIWGVAACDQQYIFCSHNANIRILVIRNFTLFAGDDNGVIKKYNLLKFTETAAFNETEEKKIKFFWASWVLDRIIVVSGERTLKVWNSHKKIVLFEWTAKRNINQLVVAKDELNFFLVFNKKIEIWNVKSFTKSFSLIMPKKIEHLALDEGLMKIHCVFKGMVKSFDSPFGCKDLAVYGDFSNSYKFVEYIHRIFSGLPVKYSSRMNHFVIEPFHINILHIYSYFNMKSHLENAVKSGVSFISSYLKYDPIDICISKHYTESLNIILSNYLPILNAHPQLFYLFGKYLTKLNYLCPQFLHLIYVSGFRKSGDSTVPHFCKGTVRLPIIVQSNDLMLNPNDFMPKENYLGKDQTVEFYNSYFKVNTVAGSRESLDFLKSLILCQNLEVFNTLFVSNVIAYKWRVTRWVHFFDFILYLAYLIFLVLGTVSHSVHYFLWVSLTVNQMLLVYEITQIASSANIYFRSFSNYIDLIRGVLFNVLWAFEYFNLYEEYQNQIFLATFFISIVRFFWYFKLFKATRWFTYLIYEIVVQLTPLAIITGYIISSLFILNYLLNNIISLSQLDNIKLTLILFLFILIINPLVIINLFLSIIGNALERVSEERNAKDLQRQTEMIFEAESLFICRRSQKNNTFVHMCLNEQETLFFSSSLVEKIRSTAEKTEEIAKFYKENKLTFKLKHELTQALNEIEEKVNKFIK